MDHLMAQAEALGVLPRFWDLTGIERVTQPETAEALIVAMGAEPGVPAPDGPGWKVVEPGTFDPGGAWQIRFENGSEHEGAGSVDLPLGIHWWESERCWLLAAPAALALPDRGWGVTAPLYGLCPAGAAPIGTYSDLGCAAMAAGAAGARFFGVNPVHAGFPADPKATSPYSPSDRRRFSTDYLSAPELPPGPELIDYPAARAALRTALEARFRNERDTPAVRDYVAEGGAELWRFATHQALSDIHGPYWPDWPDAYHDPRSPAVTDFEKAEVERILYHAWAQSLAEEELAWARDAAKSSGSGLYLDLAVGTRPDGAETWAEPESFAKGVSLGAPPDAFAPEGQLWGLAPFNPRVLVSSGFRALSETLRVQFRYASMLRIDHILGFERAFWIPETGAPGAYVAMPRDAMLAVARIEAARANAVVVGEDLGMIPDGLQEALSASGILGCRLALFETKTDWSRPATDYAERALTSWGTHDVATYAGWRRGADIALRRALGHLDQAEADWAWGERRAEIAALDHVAGAGVEAMHAHLAATPSRLVAVQAEDALGLDAQSNLPGTIHEHPNWRRRLGVTAEALGEALGPVARTMRAAGR